MSARYFPLLHGNSELVEAIKSVQLAQKSVIDITARIQNSCEHDFDEDFVEDKNYTWSFFNQFDKKVLISKTCEKCGFIEKRPDGFPWQICYKCWSPMTREETIPVKGNKTFVYKCTSPKCTHIVCHI